jgi:DNA-binding beta-propeller fold protein YncE
MAALTTTLSVAASAQSVKTTISLPYTPAGIATDPIRSKVYVIDRTSLGSASYNLAVIDGKTDTFVKNFAIPVGSSFVAVDYVINQIYVSGCNSTAGGVSCTVAVLNGVTGDTIASVPVTTTPGLGLTGIVVNPLSHRVYVANASDNVVDIIDGCQGKLLGTIDLEGNSPSAIAINPVANLLYVPFGTNLTAVVSPSRRRILSTTTFGESTVGVASDMISGRVFVADSESSTASQTGILDVQGNLLTSLAVDSSPLGVDVDPFTSLAFIAIPSLDSVTVIDESSNTVKATITGVPARYVAVDPVSEKVYVAGRRGVTVLTEN